MREKETDKEINTCRGNERRRGRNKHRLNHRKEQIHRYMLTKTVIYTHRNTHRNIDRLKRTDTDTCKQRIYISTERFSERHITRHKIETELETGTCTDREIKTHRKAQSQTPTPT